MKTHLKRELGPEFTKFKDLLPAEHILLFSILNYLDASYHYVWGVSFDNVEVV